MEDGIYKGDFMKLENQVKIMQLYMKERDYERSVFGEYRDAPLSLPSFLIFLKEYVDKAHAEYTGVWSNELPQWLLNCDEYEQSGNAPVKAYEELIKIMALAGAALETFTEFEPSLWRTNPEKDSKKWTLNSGKGEYIDDDK